MKEIERLCDIVLDKAKEHGGSISAVAFQQMVGAEHYRAVKMKLLTLELIERREDTKIRLTPKGLKVKNIKHAKKTPWTRSDKIAFAALIIALLSMIISIIK